MTYLSWLFSCCRENGILMSVKFFQKKGEIIMKNYVFICVGGEKKIDVLGIFHNFPFNFAKINIDIKILFPRPHENNQEWSK